MLQEIVPSIFENLYDLYQDTYHLEYETDFYDNPVDTSNLLVLLRLYALQAITHLTTNNTDLLHAMLDAMEIVCENGLDILGHRIGFNSTTGPYSVRLQTIDRIRAMLEFTLPDGIIMPTYNKPGYEFYMPYGDTRVKVSCRRIGFTKYSVWFYLSPAIQCENGEFCNHVKWECDLSYEQGNKGELPFFMTYYEYERI